MCESGYQRSLQTHSPPTLVSSSRVTRTCLCLTMLKKPQKISEARLNYEPFSVFFHLRPAACIIVLISFSDSQFRPVWFLSFTTKKINNFKNRCMSAVFGQQPSLFSPSCLLLLLLLLWLNYLKRFVLYAMLRRGYLCGSSRMS